jgi:hypothetical protein
MQFWRWLLVGVLFLSACGILDEADSPESLDENGCYPGEVYDPADDTCYIECDTGAECEALEAEIYDQEDPVDLDADSFSEQRAEPEPTRELEFEGEPVIGSEFEDEIDAGPGLDGSSVGDELSQLAQYAVDDRLDLTPLNVTADVAVDTAEYEEIWAVIRSILPPDILVEEVHEYWVFTDGPDGTLAYVEPLADDPDRWLMAVDPADVKVVDSQLSDDVIHTIVHEFAHILTLEDAQVTPDLNMDGTQPSATAIACTTFYTGEGCALPNSYINQFFYAFWEDLFDQTLDIEEIAEESAREDAVFAFYEAYADRFVTDYAATNPGEDIAESFAFFVLYDEPTSNTIADEKIRFFDNYPQMVAIRDHINGQFE